MRLLTDIVGSSPTGCNIERRVLFTQIENFFPEIKTQIEKVEDLNSALADLGILGLIFNHYDFTFSPGLRSLFFLHTLLENFTLNSTARTKSELEATYCDNIVTPHLFLTVKLLEPSFDNARKGKFQGLSEYYETPKKAGRPRKLGNKTNAKPVTSETGEKRGRGRPRKVAVETT